MSNKKAALRAAFPLTLPVMAGYIVLGTAFGILMNHNGLSPLWTLFASTFIYAGSMQFVAVSLLSLGFDPIGAFLMTLMVNARHLFYGISMLERYQGLGKIKPYLVFALTDETFSIVSSVHLPEGIHRHWFYFYLSLLNHSYWILGSLLGSVAGRVLPIDTTGIDFVLTALFTVIFIDQWKSTNNHFPALLGIIGAMFSRLIFGPDDFIIPSMIFIIIVLTWKNKFVLKESS